MEITSKLNFILYGLERKKEGRKELKGRRKGGREGISLYLIINHKTMLPPLLAFVLISCVFSTCV